MSEKPELWAFVLANVGLLVVSGLLTALSYLAYRQRNGQRTYFIATTGFGFVVLGGLVEPLYQLRTGLDFTISSTEFMLLESLETVLIAMGLGLLFYTITVHGSRSSGENQPDPTDEDVYEVSKPRHGDW